MQLESLNCKNYPFLTNAKKADDKTENMSVVIAKKKHNIDVCYWNSKGTKFVRVECNSTPVSSG